ncbi:hypothetical protein OG819_00030 [Streptomyces sp. NBC_01549]|uniref:hypothetical protein n=1 Tax=Streptomyces sp. NBC_01549 TaxID=2975874 RepID=UPI00224D37A1|nr:hypothetical protein [Streptomyces sp. NBC_01549]MCX4588194.1 hypothetical protein [Streptomyces sp. NBC_01549]
MRWPGAEPPSDHWREDTLMGLVRFLRHVFTAAVEDRADYQFLLEGAWALERMRLNDPTQREQLLSCVEPVPHQHDRRLDELASCIQLNP